MSCGPCTTAKEETTQIEIDHDTMQLPRSLRLYYFDFPGRAEPIRMALEVAGLPYEDVRIPRAEWPQRKMTFPFTQIPTLEVDGEPIPQTAAILNYVCELGGLKPKNPLSEARCIAIYGAVEDIIARVVAPWLRAPVEKRAGMLEDCINKGLKPQLPLLEAYVANGQKNGFCVDGKLSAADLMIFNVVRNSTMGGFPFDIEEEVAKNYPALYAVCQAVSKVPAIQAYIARRGVLN